MVVTRLIQLIRRRVYIFFNDGLSVDLYKFKKLGGKIGSDCEIAPDVEFGSEPYLISIGNHVRLTKGVKFITHDGGTWVLRGLGIENIDIFGPITIGNNVNIGWNAIILPNVSIGDNCIIGAGAIVTRDIPNNSIAVGVPAKVIESIDTYKEKALEKCDYTKQYSWKEKKKYLINKYE